MPRITKRRVLIVLAAVFGAFFIFIYGKWRDASNRGGQQPVEPFRIAGNLYYVGANDVTAFLITGPEGHILIDGGYPGTAPMIIASIAKLGFNIRDVKILLNSHSHLDHAGGLAELQKASGAQLWVSEGDADIVARGGAGDPFLGPFRLLSYLWIFRYPPPHVDQRFHDGALIKLGTTGLTAHVTPGHTPGCTSWGIPVHEANRDLLAVSICSLGITPAFALAPSKHPELKAEFEQSFATLRALPADIFLGAHANFFGLRRKMREREKFADPADAFIDRDGYRRYIDDAEASFRAELKKEADKQKH